MDSILPKPPAPPTAKSLFTPKPAPAFDESSLRDFSHVPGTRKAVYDSALEAASNIQPMTNDRHTLKLSNVRYVDPENISKKQFKDAVLTGKTLSRRLQGDWELVDNATGALLDKRSQIVASVPHITDLGTMVLGGNEYTLNSQQRLKPGVYTRVKANGEIESHANILPGKGPAHRYLLDPAKGVFKIKIGQSEMPLFPLLKAMGVTDTEFKKSWGNELYESNAKTNDMAVLHKLRARLLGKNDQSAEDVMLHQKLNDVFNKMEIDPEVTQRTLGSSFANMGKDAILATTRKLLAVNRGEQSVDDRDHLAYQTFHGPEDLFAERITKDHGGLRRAAFWKASNQGNLRSMPSGVMTKQLQQAILGSGLGQNLEEINAIEILDKNSKVTRMGEGGIPCYSEDTEVLTETGWKLWPEVSAVDRLACRVGSNLTFRVPKKLIVSDYCGPMFECAARSLNYCVTPNHRMYVSYITSGNRAWSAYGFRTAEELHKKTFKVLVASRQECDVKDPEFFFIPPAPVQGQNAGSQRLEATKVPFDAWVVLVAAYLADGSFTYAVSRKEYRIEIGKKVANNPAEYETIKTALERCGLTWRYEQGRRFVISGKFLAYYFSQFGKSRDKFVPDYIKTASAKVRAAFLSVLTTHDCSGTTPVSRTYASASKQLRDDVAMLALRAGFSVGYREIKADNQHLVRITTKSEAVVSRSRSKFNIVPYDSKVYCAEIEGGLLFVRRAGVCHWSGNSLDSVPDEARSVQPSHYGFMDPVRTPESDRVGVDTYISNNVRKGKDGRIYSQFVDRRTGNKVWKTPQELLDSVIAFPNVIRNNPDAPLHPVMRGGKIEYAPKEDVDYELPAFEHAFSPLANLVPLKSAVKAQRMAMASRMFTQSLSLSNPEAPLVQSGMPGTGGAQSYESHYGSFAGAVKAPKDGQVVSVDDGNVHVRYNDGTEEHHELYQMHPFNRKSYLHQTPVVTPGMPIKAGQVLARSNYTDKDGNVALGTNLRTAYMPWKGYNFEDANVISESAAKKFTSEHMYQHQLEVSPQHKVGKSTYASIFPGTYDKKTLDKLDDKGVIKPGMIVRTGDPLIVAAKEKEYAHNKILKRGAKAFSDASVTWDHHDPGVVTDVTDSPDGPVVVVKSTTAAKVGDKISGRYGDKGVLAAIIPDHQMPVDSQGRPFEVLLNPLGVVTRTNPAQMHELYLGKIAELTGKPIAVSDFEDIRDLRQHVSDLLNQHGLKSTEDVYDPNKKRMIKGIATGNRFFMKLHHTSESKVQGRGGGGYSSEDTPTKGGPSGSKRISMLDSNALLSMGAIETLRDVSLVRGQARDDYWLQFMNGHTPSEMKVPKVYEKFINTLKGAGINAINDGPRLRFMALNNHDVRHLAGERELENADTVHFNHGLEPVKGGLFDPKLTGGHDGTQWAKITLPEPMINPVMEEPIQRILGLTNNKLMGVISGEHQLGNYGTGPKAIQKAVEDIDVDKEIEKARLEMNSGSKSRKDAANRRLEYLKAAKKMQIHPRDWILDSVPVIPPKFRPVSLMGDSGIPLVADANYLYKELMNSKSNFNELKKHVDDSGLGQERLGIYNAFKALVGLGDPTHPKLQEKRVGGLLKSVFGNSPKYGMLQRKLISSTVDNVGRAVITPNPDYDMDTVGLPEGKAFEVYEKFLVRRLRQSGMPLIHALDQVRNKTPIAKKALLEEMEARPVYINRAPVLHKFGIMAFRPKLAAGDAMQISPLIVKGFNADFDGDAMQFHVPSTDEAVKEAYERMLPSRNLLKPADLRSPAHGPVNEFISGLHHASTSESKKQPRVFRTAIDALAAYARHELDVDDPVEIMEH